MKIIRFISCKLNIHNYKYFSENYHTSKSIFKCINCKKEIEQ